MAPNQTDLSAFRRSLAQHPEAVSELPSTTYWRYVNGVFPPALDWLMRHPDLLRALADDAETLLSLDTAEYSTT